jgi:hypothetical protein
MNNNSPQSKNQMEFVVLTDVENLNDDQQWAYDIVDWHLRETIAAKILSQLLIMIPGEGSVGKSKLI